MTRLALLVSIAAVVASGCSRGPDPHAEETARREAFARQALEARDAGRALLVASSSAVQFEEGFSVLSYENDEAGHPGFENHAFRWMGQYAHVRLKRLGDRPMRLVLAGWVHEKVVRSKVDIDLYIDGVYVGSTDRVDPKGHYWIERVIPPQLVRRPWVDLVIRTSSVGFHWSDPPELRVLNVYRFGWTEVSDLPAPPSP